MRKRPRILLEMVSLAPSNMHGYRLGDGLSDRGFKSSPVFDVHADTSGTLRSGRQRIRISATAVYGVSVPLWEPLFSAQLDPLFDEARVNLPYAGWSGMAGLKRGFL